MHTATYIVASPICYVHIIAFKTTRYYKLLKGKKHPTKKETPPVGL